MYSVPFHAAHNMVSYALVMPFPNHLGLILRMSSSTVSHLAVCSSKYLTQGERNILADPQTSQMGSVLGGELMSIVSSVVVMRPTVGPYQFVPPHAYRSRSDMLQQGGRHRRRGGRGDSMSYDGVKRLLVGKSGNNELSSLGCHAKQKAFKKSSSH